jgi:hypothetical protein
MNKQKKEQPSLSLITIAQVITPMKSLHIPSHKVEFGKALVQYQRALNGCPHLQHPAPRPPPCFLLPDLSAPGVPTPTPRLCVFLSRDWDLPPHVTRPWWRGIVWPHRSSAKWSRILNRCLPPCLPPHLYPQDLCWRFQCGRHLERCSRG